MQADMIPMYKRQNNTENYFDHRVLFGLFAKWMAPVHYLELGVREGIVFNEVSRYCTKATAVDINPIQFELPSNAEYYHGTTDSYFQQLPYDTKFDFIFIDADHSYEQSLKDFINAQRYLIEDGLICLHDTYPPDMQHLDPNYCNDSYKTALYIKNNMTDEFEVTTLPFSPGVTIIRKIKKSKQVVWI